MKHFAVAMGLGVVLISLSSVSDAALFPPYNNTVAAWLFDEQTGTTIQDATTNNNTGTLSTFGGDVTLNTAVKKFGQSSLKTVNPFSGDGAIVPDSTSLHVLTNNFTVEGWFRWDGSNPLNTLLSRADATTASGYQWEFGTSSLTNLIVAVSSSAGTILVTASQFPSNQFVHVAFTYSSGVVNLYTNGVLAGSGSNPSVVPSGIGRIGIGTFVGGTSGIGIGLRSGWIDEVRLSDIVRIPGDGTGTNNFLAWNGSLIPEPTAITMSLLGLAWIVLPVVRRARR